MKRQALLTGLLAALALTSYAPSAAWADIGLVDGEKVDLTISGYVRTFDAVTWPGTQSPDPTGVSTNIGRLEWRSNLGDHVSLEVHQRLEWIQRDSSTFGSFAGAGNSAAPARRLDLESEIVEESTLRIAHDIDRLALRIYLDEVDVIVGRQAITWGYGQLFTVADLWTRFSPYDIDAVQKRGVDAARALFSLGANSELDVIVADQGDDDVGGALRAVFYLSSSDVYVSAGKFWNEIMLLSGVSTDLGSSTLRADYVQPYDYDRARVEAPRVTLGYDYIHPDWMLSLEAHYNGVGEESSDDYFTHVTGDERFARGESYLLGRWYAGTSFSWFATDLLSLSTTFIGNLQDPSALVAPAVSWNISQDVDLALGSYHGLGQEPRISPVLQGDPSFQGIDLNSEYGQAGDTFYLTLVAFY